MIKGFIRRAYFRYHLSPELRDNVLKFFKKNGDKILRTKDWTTALNSGSHAERITELFAFVMEK